MAYWQAQANHVLEARLDNDEYDDSELMFIKLPAPNLDYTNESSEFERVDGEITLGDITYTFVKQRLFKDSIELMCIRNAALTKIGRVRNLFFGQTNNLNHFPNTKLADGNDFQKVYSPSALCFLFRRPDPIGNYLTEFLVPSPAAGHCRMTERPPSPLAV